MERKRRYRDRNAAYVLSVKEGRPCGQCGRLFPHYAMDFDHVGDGDKTLDICAMVHTPVSMAVLVAEIAKCELVCAVCHRIRTWERRQA